MTNHLFHVVYQNYPRLHVNLPNAHKIDNILHIILMTSCAEEMYWMINDKRKEGSVIMTLNDDGNSYRESNELSCRWEGIYKTTTKPSITSLVLTSLKKFALIWIGQEMQPSPLVPWFHHWLVLCAFQQRRKFTMRRLIDFQFSLLSLLSKASILKIYWN